MPGWLTLPLLIDLILIGMTLETGWLIWRHRRAGASGLPPFLLHVISGLLLLAATRFALQSTDLQIVAGVLGLAGIIHFLDLKLSGIFDPLQSQNALPHPHHTET
ncbi:MAG: hypothetical protein P8H99_04600 [Luminiphilus sp.]|nr:hypothetical protein [Luminiphilus sp.]